MTRHAHWGRYRTTPFAGIALLLALGCAPTKTLTLTPVLAAPQGAGNLGFAVVFSPKVTFTFENKDTGWVYYKAHSDTPAQPQSVNDLCNVRPSGEQLSDSGVFVAVTIQQAKAGPKTGGVVTVPIKVEATYDDTGNEATHSGTLALNSKGALVCRHPDNQ